MSERPPASSTVDESAAVRPLSAASTLVGGPGRRERSPYADRFRAVTAVLAGMGIAAVVVAITILATNNSSGPSAIWSSWSPPDSGLTGESEIANDVAPFYRASPAAQLVIVTVQNISSTGSSSSSGASSSGAQVAIRDPSTGSLSAVSGTTAVYSLCGLGPSCAISGGSPSTARELLLRREALQLALYTFKYISGVDNVVALLPPAHAAQQLTRKPPAATTASSSSTVNIAIAFQRTALREFLSRPLVATLPEQLPPSVSQMETAPEAELVSVVTGQALFQQQLVHSQAGSTVLVLNPLPPQ
jgi:hypothetical protein